MVPPMGKGQRLIRHHPQSDVIVVGDRKLPAQVARAYPSVETGWCLLR